MDLEADIRQCVDACAGLLPDESLSEVRHFLDHGEHEMAFEGLVLELIEHKIHPAGFAAARWMTLADSLGLRDESVFVGDFWARLSSWAEGADESARGDSMKPCRLAEAIAQALARGESLAELAALLRRLRDLGLSQAAAYDTVEALRMRAAEVEEDRLLEVLDIVSGFCAPGLRVWGYP